jgi:hypothetical protein
MKETKWLGDYSPTCDFCKIEIINDVRKKSNDCLYDGKTVLGPWALMCEEHFQELGIGLGIGKGQKLIFRSKK